MSFGQGCWPTMKCVTMNPRQHLLGKGELAMTINQYAHHVEHLRQDYERLKRLAGETKSDTYKTAAEEAKTKWKKARQYLARRKRQEAP